MNQSGMPPNGFTEDVRLEGTVSRATGRVGCIADVLMSLGLGWVLIDGNERVAGSNLEARRLCGWTEGAPNGDAVDLAIPVAGLRETIWTLLNTSARCRVVYGTLVGRNVRLTLLSREDAESRYVMIVMQDVAGLSDGQDSFSDSGRCDPLTGLPDRAWFMTQLRKALQEAGHSGDRFALVYLDLDRFKEINNTRGHVTGDAVLIETGARLRDASLSCRAIARLGDDAFALITDPIERDGAADVVTRVLHLIRKPLETIEETVSVGVSAGLAMFPDDGNSLDDLYRHADMAMYQAKAAGGGWRFYSSEMSVDMDARVRLAERLAQAVRGGNLELYFQPQICLETDALAGAEALLRWRDPVHGWISPAEFIPVAEERGMMGALGLWVLETACAQLRDWREAGLHLPGRLAVNVSAHQLDDTDIVEKIVSTVRKAGAQPEDLEIELTEGAVMKNLDAAIRVLECLRAEGFTFALDDFGSGYSSLNHLQRLPVDKLKIDIVFVREMLWGARQRAMVAAIIGMGRALGIEVLAEGVEGPEQARELAALECDAVQGYWYGRPVSATEFAAVWLARS